MPDLATCTININFNKPAQLGLVALTPVDVPSQTTKVIEEEHGPQIEKKMEELILHVAT